jgi:O-methyltransferase
MSSAWIAEFERPERITPVLARAAKHLRVGLLTREQCLNLYYLLTRVVNAAIPGDVVELGCHAGGSALLIQAILRRSASRATLHVYDSFSGLPPHRSPDLMEDGRFFLEGLSALSVSRETFVRNFADAELLLPEIHAGWFHDTLPQQLPERICFAHLDCDLYESTREALAAVYPRLVPGAVVILDDYCEPALFPHRNIFPGVKCACDEFLADKPERIEILHGGVECHACFTRSPA